MFKLVKFLRYYWIFFYFIFFCQAERVCYYRPPACYGHLDCYWCWCLDWILNCLRPFPPGNRAKLVSYNQCLFIPLCFSFSWQKMSWNQPQCPVQRRPPPTSHVLRPKTTRIRWKGKAVQCRAFCVSALSWLPLKFCDFFFIWFVRLTKRLEERQEQKRMEEEEVKGAAFSLSVVCPSVHSGKWTHHLWCKYEPSIWRTLTSNRPATFLKWWWWWWWSEEDETFVSYEIILLCRTVSLHIGSLQPKG